MNQWNGGNGYPPGGGGFPQQGGFPQPQQGGFPQPQQQRFSPPASFGGGANPFGGINDADPTGSRLPYFEPGSYLVVIDDIKYKEARSGKSFYIIETTIEQSNNPVRQVGTPAACMIDMSNKDMRGVNLKRFLGAALGVDPESDCILPGGQHWSPKGPVAPDGRPWDHVAMDSCSDAQPLRGRRLSLNVVPTKTKGGGDFSVHMWQPAGQQAAAPQTPQQPAYPQQPQAAPQQPQAVPGAYPTQHGMPAPAPGVMPPGFNPGVMPPGFNPAAGPPQQQPQQPPQQPPQGFPPGFNPGAPPQGWNPPR